MGACIHLFVLVSFTASRVITVRWNDNRRKHSHVFGLVVFTVLSISSITSWNVIHSRILHITFRSLHLHVALTGRGFCPYLGLGLAAWKNVDTGGMQFSICNLQFERSMDFSFLSCSNVKPISQNQTKTKAQANKHKESKQQTSKYGRRQQQRQPNSRADPNG